MPIRATPILLIGALAAVLSATAALEATAGFTEPVYEMERTAHRAPEGTTLEQIAVSIERAGGAHGWTTERIAPGHSEATVEPRGRHTAVVSIEFDEKTYVIRYKSSVNLDYDADGLYFPDRAGPRHRRSGEVHGPVIHHLYNNWVRNLMHRIELETATPPPPDEASYDEAAGGTDFSADD